MPPNHLDPAACHDMPPSGVGVGVAVATAVAVLVEIAGEPGVPQGDGDGDAEPAAVALGSWADARTNADGLPLADEPTQAARDPTKPKAAASATARRTRSPRAMTTSVLAPSSRQTRTASETLEMRCFR